MSREQELFESYMNIRQLADAVRNKNIAEAGLLGDTTRGRGRVFSLLLQEDGISTKELANRMGIRVSSLNEVLGKMEKEGYIERYPSKDDRRVMLVELTEKGRAVELPTQDMPKIMFGKLTPFAKDELTNIFDEIIASLQKELGIEEEAAETQAAPESAAQEEAPAVTAESTTPEPAQTPASEEPVTPAAASVTTTTPTTVPTAAAAPAVPVNAAAPSTPVAPAPAAAEPAPQPAAPIEAEPVQKVQPAKPVQAAPQKQEDAEEESGSFKKFFSRFSR